MELGWKEREKEGLPRVLEALESHLWSSIGKESGSTTEKSDESVSENITTEQSDPMKIEAESEPTDVEANLENLEQVFLEVDYYGLCIFHYSEIYSMLVVGEEMP